MADCTYPGCTNQRKRNGRCIRHQNVSLPRDGVRIVQVERSIPGGSCNSGALMMDVSLPAEPWEVSNV